MLLRSSFEALDRCQFKLRSLIHQSKLSLSILFLLRIKYKKNKIKAVAGSLTEGVPAEAILIFSPNDTTHQLKEGKGFAKKV